MKNILIVLLYCPLVSVSQEVVCVGTEVMDGYFYQLHGKSNTTYTITTGPMANDAYFISSAQLRSGTLKEHILSSLYENDTVKYVSRPAPRVFNPYYLADSACKKWLESGVTVSPFKVGQAGSDSEVEGYTIFATYAKVEWLHVRVGAIAASSGSFNRPVTFDHSVKRRNNFFDYYVPMKVLELREGMRVYDGKFYTQAEFQALMKKKNE